MRLFIFAVLAIANSVAFAYIPPTRMILNRVAENAGSGTYIIEQEVQINAGLDPIYLKETWVVENERSMRLTVTGSKELKDLVKMQFVYVGGQKWQLRDGRKESLRIPEEFAERFFHIRSSDNMFAYLQGMKILPAGAATRKTFTKGKNDEFKYEPEPNVRLSRVEGTVNYAFGAPTAPDQKDANPGMWVEQDQFVIRKIRFPSQAEITAESYGNYVRNLDFPKVRTVQWNQNTVLLRVLSVSGKGKEAGGIQASNIEVPYTIRSLPNPAAQTVIEEFYTRFR